jgi:hypothetical protein
MYQIQQFSIAFSQLSTSNVWWVYGATRCPRALELALEGFVELGGDGFRGWV